MVGVAAPGPEGALGIQQHDAGTAGVDIGDVDVAGVDGNWRLDELHLCIRNELLELIIAPAPELAVCVQRQAELAARGDLHDVFHGGLRGGVGLLGDAGAQLMLRGAAPGVDLAVRRQQHHMAEAGGQRGGLGGEVQPLVGGVEAALGGDGQVGIVAHAPDGAVGHPHEGIVGAGDDVHEERSVQLGALGFELIDLETLALVAAAQLAELVVTPDAQYTLGVPRIGEGAAQGQHHAASVGGRVGHGRGGGCHQAERQQQGKEFLHARSSRRIRRQMTTPSSAMAAIISR